MHRPKIPLSAAAVSRRFLRAAAFVGASTALGAGAVEIATPVAGDPPKLDRVLTSRTRQRTPPSPSLLGPLVYTGGGVNNLFSNPANFGGSVPTAGRDLLFGATPSGDYTLENDLSSTAFKLITLDRAQPTQTTTITNGLSATGAHVARGSLVLDGGTSTLTGDGTSRETVSLFAGSVQGGNGAITLSNGANVSGDDFIAGGVTFADNSTPPVETTITSNGSITVTGAGTRFQPRLAGSTTSYFGSTDGTATVLIDDNASVNAFRGYLRDHGSFIVRNGGILTLSPLDAVGFSAELGVGLNPNANAAFELSSGGSITVENHNDGTASTAWFGQGQNSTTVANFASGGSFSAGIITFGGAENTASRFPTPANSVSTFTVTGAGTFVTGTTSFGVNGSASLAANIYGNATLNVLDGAQVTSPFVAFAGGDRLATSPIQSNTFVTVSGANSAIRARTGDGDGTLLAGAGTNTTTLINLTSGGTLDADLFFASPAANAKTTINVGVGSAITTDQFATGYDFFLPSPNAEATLNINGGAVHVSGLSVLGYGVAQARNVSGSTGTLNINAGGIYDTHALFASVTRASTANINVSGVGAQLTVVDLFNTGDINIATGGTGRTLVTVSAGGAASFGTIIAGATPNSTAPDTIGTRINVTGAGSQITVAGTLAGGETGTETVAADVILGVSIRNRAELNVLDGGLFTIKRYAATPQLNGALFVASDDNASAFVTVDGAGATLDAGLAVRVTPSDPSFPLQGATGIVTVRNGGVLKAGDVTLAHRPGSGLTSTLNIGGGTNPTLDAASRVAATGFVLVGGDDVNGVATVGAPATININNGRLDAGVLRIYAGSNVSVNKGVIEALLINARGGNVTLSPTAAAGTALLVANDFKANNGGVIDIGRSGGVSYFDLASGDEDLSEIKSLIVAGLAGAANSIRSSAIVPGSNLAIGYAHRVPGAGALASFLGETFAAGDSAVIFRVTLNGDANLTGKVDFADLVVLAQNYNATGREWFQADFNYDGAVGFADLVALAQNYNGVVAGGVVAALGGADFAADWALAQSLVPEPVSGVLLLSALAMTRTRRRR